MRYIDDTAAAALLDVPSLVPVMRQAFMGELGSAPRAHHTLPALSTSEPSTLLMMPAWRPGKTLGVKIVTVEPARSRRGLHAVEGVYLLFDGDTGAPTAVLGARALTAARTAAVSALAASYLAREDASTLLMVGTGTLAAHFIRGHVSVRPIRKVLCWGRTESHAQTLVETIRAELPNVEFAVAERLETACNQADIISCATSSSSPLILSEHVRPGTHVDLVGSFTPHMREVDSALMARGRLVVDTLGGFDESGDLAIPCAEGLLKRENAIDLSTLVQSPAFDRHVDDITLFKAVGTAIADLAAAEYLLVRAAEANKEQE